MLMSNSRIQVYKFIQNCIDVLVYTVKCVNELQIHQRLKLNQSEYITVQEFDTQESWEKYQQDVSQHTQNIEVIPHPDNENSHTECLIL